MSDPIRRALSGGPGCPPLEALAAPSPEAAVQRHLDSCPHCQNELAMFQQFEAAELRSGEATDLAWVEAELDRRRVPALQLSWIDRIRASLGTMFLPEYRGRLSFATVAALLIVAGIALYVPSRGVRNPEVDSPAVWRSGQVIAIAPLGDLDRAPTQLRWEAVPGAASYRVRVLEVDGTEVWSSNVPAATADIPADLAAKMIPGRAFQWEVEARNASGKRIASTGLQNFHIVTTIR